MVVFIFSTPRDDRYGAVKKACYVSHGIASQCINLRTLSKPERMRAIVQKIALQMNCKLGGYLWRMGKFITPMHKVGGFFHSLQNVKPLLCWPQIPHYVSVMVNPLTKMQVLDGWCNITLPVDISCKSVHKMYTITRVPKMRLETPGVFWELTVHRGEPNRPKNIFSDTIHHGVWFHWFEGERCIHRVWWVCDVFLRPELWMICFAWMVDWLGCYPFMRSFFLTSFFWIFRWKMAGLSNQQLIGNVDDG